MIILYLCIIRLVEGLHALSCDGLLFILFLYFIFIYFSSLIAMARTSKTMLNNCGESGHPCLVPDLRGNAFSFSPLRMMFVIYGLYYVKAGSLYAHFLESFYHKWLLNFVKSFFCIYWDDHVVFILQFVNMVYHIDRFVYIEESLHTWDKSHLIMVYDPFNVLLDSLC